MTHGWWHILLLLCVLSSETNAVSCPDPCMCVEENGGKRLELICDQGGLKEGQFQDLLLKASIRTTVIKIIGPPARPNNFSISSNFNRFKRLEEIHLVNCAVRWLGKGVFRNIPTLRTLNLAWNHIAHISSETFEGTGHLETLNLDENHLAEKNLPTGAFTYLKNLKSLSLRGNRIKVFPGSFLTGLESLRELFLDRNFLTDSTLIALLADVPKLERLELNRCGLKGLQSETFHNVPNLRVLSLAFNNYGGVPVLALEPLGKLQSLSLAGNNISFVSPFAFAHVPIQSLDLSDNQLGADYKANTVPKSGIEPLSLSNTSLTLLDLSRNGYHDFAAGPILGTAGESIRVLLLSGNPLRTIKESQTAALDLKALHMANVGMRQLPSKLPPNFQHLQLLNLSGNALNRIPIEAAKQLAPALRHLDISNAAFSHIPSDIHEVLVGKLSSLYAHGNPWDCACHIIPLRDYFSARKGRCRQLKLDQIRCVSPPEMVGERLVSLEHPPGCAVIFGQRSGLTQQSEIGILVAGLMAIFLLISIGLLMACWGKMWRRAGTYRTREDSRNQLSPSDSDHSDMILPQPVAKERLF